MIENHSKYDILFLEWASDNPKALSDVTHGSTLKALWNCSKCGYIWSARVKDRFAGQGCMQCYRSKPKAKTNATKLIESHPHLQAEYLKSNNRKFNTLTSGSAYKALWTCGVHIWEQRIYNRIRGKGCPSCLVGTQTSKIENEFRTAITGSVCNPTKVFLSNGKTATVDIFLPEYNAIIEYDGWYWHRTKTALDTRKTKEMLATGYTVVRIRERTKRGRLYPVPVMHANLYQVLYDDTKPIQMSVNNIKSWLNTHIS